MTVNLSWQLLHDLERLAGDAFYLLDLSRFESNYQEFRNAFCSVYSNSQIAYSYKTNYTPRLCQMVNALGGYAEVVSRMEYDLAVRIGVPPERVIFNGPLKRAADLEVALLAGAFVNLDSYYEADVVAQIAAASPGQPLTIGLRCNFDIGAPAVSRFGFDVFRPEFRSLLASLGKLENCRIIGLHCHFLAPQRSAEAYGGIARQMLAIADEHFDTERLRFIDLGGGFFSHMSESFKAQFDHPIPSFADYAQAIASPFAARFGQRGGPALILEPGLALTADIMKMVTKTIDVKQVQSRTMALLSSSIYEIKPTLSPRNLPIHLVRAPTGRLSPTVMQKIDLVGYTCMEGDCLYQGFEGALAPGDYVVFENVGAYTNVLKPPFINPAPPIIGYDGATGRFEVIRRREEMNDLFATYVF